MAKGTIKALVVIVIFILLVGATVACAEPFPPPTPEGPSILRTIAAMLPAEPPTPEAPGILKTIAAKPTPTPPTPEAPAIMATITQLLATPTPTPTPTNTPGPTPTPRDKESSSFTVGGAEVKFMPIKLAPGERVEGFYNTQHADIASFKIQDPTSKIVKDYGSGAASNFEFTATSAGLYSLVFQARQLGAFERVSVTFTISYSYEIYPH